MSLVEKLRGLPPEALVPVSWVLAEVRAVAGEEADNSAGDLRVEEVAVRMHRKPPTVRGWIRSGLLDAYRFRGRDWRVTEEALRRFVERERAGAPQSLQIRSERGQPLDLAAWRGGGKSQRGG